MKAYCRRRVSTKIRHALHLWLLFLLIVTTVHVVDVYTLATFDVDGTFVQDSGQAVDTSAHSRAFSHAVAKVFAHDDDSKQTNVVQHVAEALPRELYHGSTDGLILLRLARATLGKQPSETFPKLDQMMDTMYEYISELSDVEVAERITPLPGILETLEQLAQ